MNKNLHRLRRTMMFLNAQRPGLIKDAYIYKPDTLIFDLEDAVAENQKDSARFSLYHALKRIDYGTCERMVRINALDTPYWKEDIRVTVAAGADSIRISKCEKAQDVLDVLEQVEKAEKEFKRELGSTLLMAAIESPLGLINAYDICKAVPERMIGVAISGGDYRREMQANYDPSGVEMFGARANLLIAARAAKVQCFDTVFTDLNDDEGFMRELELIKKMGFDGKSIISPRQIAPVHDMYKPSQKEILSAVKVVSAIEENKKKGIGVFVVDGKMIDIAFFEGAKRTLRLAKASGLYEGDLA